MTKETPQQDSLGEDLKTYVNLQYRLMALKLTDKVSATGSAAGERLVLGLVLAAALLFMSTGLGFFLGARLSNYALGFALVASVYLIAFLFLLAFRRRLLREPVRNTIIDNLLDEEN